MKDKTKLLILFGGVSSEHEVSRVSASSILTHINGGKYEIYTVEIWKRFRKWGGIPTGITQNVKVRPDRALCKAV